jgi:CheY-like chemotaxis protein
MNKPRVLVIDDEVEICKVFVHAMRKWWDVIACTEIRTHNDPLLKLTPEVLDGGSRRAMGLLDDPNEHFNAIFLDVIMPDLGGAVIFQRLERERSRHLQKVAIMTGGDGYESVQRFLEEAGCKRATDPRPLLLKPFSIDELRRVGAILMSKNGHHP